ncbi:SPOR domain-containing protein [Paralysiella testudinis]|uniref:SPOR domain-containing protein n=1 Tax=Paralysiella testudinis TaxID=2809020 RepID=A0A892ZEW6_9NEIS|nr:SPOR domain-containing protein [Paralysiella testudinis]QRQ81038.1 SPOR domain-containing protein [Paralysiella testudinis]
MASLNPQDSYEQLKRKNRRRLVGAVAMVAVAAALLLSVLNQNKTPASQQQEVLITGLNTDASAIAVSTGSDVTAASASDANLAPGTVLEPQPESDNQAASQAATSVAEKPAPVAGSLPPVVVTKPAATPTQQVPVQAETRAQTPGSSAKPQPSTPTRSETTSKPETKPETKPATQPTPPARPATKPPAPKPATSTPGKLSPQEILNNKAATQVVAAPKPHPQAILDGQKSNGKALIQVGAYTNEVQARTVQQKLAAVGVSATISQSETSKGTLYRVRTGTYASRAQAEQNLNRIRAQGLDGMVIGQ